jgi:phage gp29-like protein
MRFIPNIFKPKQTKALKQEKRTSSAAPAVDILRSVMDNLPVYQRWLDQDELDRISNDATVISSIGSRKAATLKKELIITCKDETLIEPLMSVFDHTVLRKILDAPFQGASVFEVNWEIQPEGYLLMPKLVERSYREFTMKNGVLYYSPYGSLTDIPEHKAVIALYEDKYHKPMGRPLAESLFWYVKFKNASLEFWIKFLEKYSVPWAIGKTDGDKNEMAEELYAMLSGDAAVIDKDDEIKIETVSKTGDFDKITSYLDNQIREAILGGNLTGNVSGGGSYAATQTHNEIREDIAMSDEHTTLQLMRKVIESFRVLNSIKEPISIILKDKDDPNTVLAERDERIYNMGYKPTKAYVERTYNIEVEERTDSTGTIANKHLQKLYAFSQNKPITSVEDIESGTDLKTIALSFRNQIVDIVDKCTSFEEAIDALHEAYPQMDIEALQDVMDSALQSSYILGSAQSEFEENEA